MNNSKIPFYARPYTDVSARDILAEIERIRTEIANDVGNTGDKVYAAPLAILKQTEIIYLISRLNEISTRRLVGLTWALVLLTVALLGFTVVLYKDTHALVEREQAAQHHELQASSPPESEP